MFLVGQNNLSTTINQADIVAMIANLKPLYPRFIILPVYNGLNEASGLALAANWLRVYDRKHVRLVALKTNG